MVPGKSDITGNRYGIGVVSRLTGVSRDALRVWERRYGVVKAQRTDSKRRLYSQDDINRLMLVKALVDTGHPISSVANLRTKELEERLAAEASSQPSSRRSLRAGPVRVVMIGPALTSLIRSDRIEVDGLQLVAAVNQPEELETPVEKLELDVLVIEHAGLFDETIDEVQALFDRSGAKRMILVYGFAARSAIARIRKHSPKVIAIRAPINATELRLACLMDVSVDRATSGIDTPIGQIPERLFSNDLLADIASASSTVQCECPQHLVTLISSLSAFEDYSESCEKRNAADAALHAHLHSVVARSRRLVEDALAAVADADGLLPKSPNVRMALPVVTF